MRIDQILIKNFKAIDMLKFKPTMVNIFTGRNNTGKTSLLEAIAFAYDNDVFDETFKSILKCPSSIINYHNTSGMIRVEVESAKIKRKLEVTFERPSLEDIIESLTSQVRENINRLEKISRDIKHIKSSSNTASETKRAESQERLSNNFLIEEAIKKLIGTKEFLHAIEECLRIDRDGVKTLFYGDRYRGFFEKAVNDALRNSGITSIPNLIGKYFDLYTFPCEPPNLSDFDEQLLQANDALPSKYQHLKQPLNSDSPTFIRDPTKIIKQLKSGKTYSETTSFQIEKILKKNKLVPGLDRFNFDSLVFSNTNMDVQMESMGDGFKVLTGLLGTLLTQPESSIMLLEEPEVHMHPGYIRELATYLIEMAKSRNIQLFLSTHSIDLIQNLLDIESLSKVNQEFVKSELSIFKLSRSQDTLILEKEKYLEAIENISELAIDLRGL